MTLRWLSISDNAIVRLDLVQGFECEAASWRSEDPCAYRVHVRIGEHRRFLTDFHSEAYGKSVIAALNEALADESVLVIDVAKFVEPETDGHERALIGNDTDEFAPHMDEWAPGPAFPPDPTLLD
jgi:hypothetical protein